MSMKPEFKLQAAKASQQSMLQVTVLIKKSKRRRIWHIPLAILHRRGPNWAIQGLE